MKRLRHLFNMRVISFVAGSMLASGLAFGQTIPGYIGKVQIPGGNQQLPHQWNLQFTAQVNGTDYNDNAPGTWTGIGGLAVTVKGTSDPNGLNVCGRNLTASYDPRWLLNDELTPANFNLALTPLNKGVNGSNCFNGKNGVEDWTDSLSNFQLSNCNEIPGTGNVIDTWQCHDINQVMINQYGNCDIYPNDPKDEGEIDFRLVITSGELPHAQWQMWFSVNDVDSDGNTQVMTSSYFPETTQCVTGM